MARFTITPQAQHDLRELWKHLANQNGAEQADAFLDSLQNKIDLLAEQPFTGRAREELSADLRSLPAKPYLIFYVVLPDSIVIVRVLHGRRDIQAIFDEDDNP